MFGTISFHNNNISKPKQNKKAPPNRIYWVGLHFVDWEEILLVRVMLLIDQIVKY
ncbi:MAG: hypothetical protein K0R15_2602 [Clostridiales bacterium]|nr:hypothetical protein [Clostridiales bacterium]